MMNNLHRVLGIALLTSVLSVAAVPSANAQAMYANDEIHCEDGDYIVSGFGDYALICWYGASPVYPFESVYLSWIYDGSGGPYEVWSSLWDGAYSGLGSHNYQWDLVSIDAHATMQGDGNFVLYNGSYSYAAWATMTHGNSGAWLNPQDDGNLVVYSSSITALWSLF